MSMFHTFTGSSRRPRNVNLSGQRSDPFASSSWSSGASQTVTHAAAERAHRQQERQRLQASKRLQRVWRGHMVRRELADARRKEVDALYTEPLHWNRSQRLIAALPLILSSYNPRLSQCHCQLDAFVKDIQHAGVQPFLDDRIHESRIRILVGILVEELEKIYYTGETPKLRDIIIAISSLVEKYPSAIALPSQYYSIFALLGKDSAVVSENNNLLLVAITAPLGRSTLSQKYSNRALQAFVFSFLVIPDLLILDQNSSLLAKEIHVDALADLIEKDLGPVSTSQTSSKDLLWLLSHLIVLGRSGSWGKKGTTFLRIVNTILQALNSNGHDLFTTSSQTDVDEDEEVDRVPDYVNKQMRSLVDPEAVSDLLSRITCEFPSSVQYQNWEQTNLLASFTLALLRAFPGSGDDIRMRLFLGDVTIGSDAIPSIQVFWLAVKNTSIYYNIVKGKKSPVDIILAGVGSSRLDANLESLEHEWKTILLFLELYVFLMRLTDDEDFFSAMKPTLAASISELSRVRASNLGFSDVKDLSIFLKTLSFSLFYDASAIMETQKRSKSASSFLSNYLEAGTFGMMQKEAVSQGHDSRTLTALFGVSFQAFRYTVITALRMLYERDSRRPFLPSNHWLMTSRFDMSGFIDAVVAEEERQREIKAQGDDEFSNADDAEAEGLVPFSTTWSSSGARLNRNARIEKLRERQRQANRDRMLAVIGPKLEVLRNMPFVIPFNTRVEIFRKFVHMDKLRRHDLNSQSDNSDTWFAMLRHGGKHHAKVRREHLLEDAMSQLYPIGDGLKDQLQITFVDQFNNPEAGIDGGGVTKEFLTSIAKENLSTFAGNRLFVSNLQNLVFPNPSAVDELKEVLDASGIAPDSAEWKGAQMNLLRQYEFLGRVLGKCLYEEVLIDVAFAGFFLLKWASSGQGGSGGDSYRANVNDLKELDAELYQGLVGLKNYPGDVSELGQDFTILNTVSLPDEPVRTITKNLVPNGQEIMVTNENRPLYISYVARHRLVVQPYQQTKAFLRGLGSIIEPSWLSMFNQNELQKLVGGDMAKIDLEDLRRHTEYTGVYQIGEDGEEHHTVKLFWQVLDEMTEMQRRDMLKYVTSTPRAPLLGFSQLHPRFTIRDSGQDEERLPSAATCVNLLKLPMYRTKEKLRHKLLYATQSGAGFDLS